MNRNEYLSPNCHPSRSLARSMSNWPIQRDEPAASVKAASWKSPTLPARVFSKLSGGGKLDSDQGRRFLATTRCQERCMASCSNVSTEVRVSNPRLGEAEAKIVKQVRFGVVSQLWEMVHEGRSVADAIECVGVLQVAATCFRN
jgi:hypothetical protein